MVESILCLVLLTHWRGLDRTRCPYSWKNYTPERTDFLVYVDVFIFINEHKNKKQNNKCQMYLIKCKKEKLEVHFKPSTRVNNRVKYLSFWVGVSKSGPQTEVLPTRSVWRVVVTTDWKTVQRFSRSWGLIFGPTTRMWSTHPLLPLWYPNDSESKVATFYPDYGRRNLRPS